MAMKRIPVFLALLFCAASVLSAQNRTATTTNARDVAADCANVDDSKLTTDVKAKLAAAPSLKDLSINVATSGGVVTLMGVANKPTQKGTASLVAKAVKCVKKVDNQMTIEGGSQKKKSKQ
jgi:osmotically-inducible protein OsmY